MIDEGESRSEKFHKCMTTTIIVFYRKIQDMVLGIADFPPHSVNWRSYAKKLTVEYMKKCSGCEI